MQKIEKRLKKEEIAFCYYSIISILNGLNLGNKEIKLLSSMATEKEFDRNKWVEKNKSSVDSYYNMKSKLTKRRMLIDGKINPILFPSFNSLHLQIHLNGETV